MEYLRGDKQLKKDCLRAGKLVQKFNSANYEDLKQKKAVLTELLGAVGEEVSIEHNFHCDLGYNIHLGENFYAGFNCTIVDIAPVTFGDNCMIAPNVGIYTAGHHINPVNRHKSGIAKPIVIGNNVWIGANVVILGGVKIGDNSVIAAGAVVNKDVPKNVVYAGSPAKKIKDIK